MTAMHRQPLRALIMAGGTGGHVFPALAVAEALRESGHEVTWMGTREGLEAKLVPAAGIPMEWIVMHGLRGKGVLRVLSAPLRILRATWQALQAIRRVRPNVVLGMGGYAAGPGGLAAWLLRRPLVIHEQNAAAGMTNKALALLARRRLQAFPGAISGAEVVGNPVRKQFSALPAPAQRFAGRQGPLRLLVMGGSLGAKALNERVPQALAQIDPAVRPEIWHQGGRTVEVARAAYAAGGIDARVDDFISQVDEAYAWADLVVCRAGAMTVAELAAAGCAALLVPFPYAVDDHQTRNGEFLVQAGAAEMIQERDLDIATLQQALRRLLGDRASLQRMAEQARAAAQPDSLARITEICLEVAA